MLVAVTGAECKDLWHFQKCEAKKKLVFNLILHCSLKWLGSASPCCRSTKVEKGKKEDFGVTCWLLKGA